MSSWGYPHDDKGQNQQVPGETCDPGMKGRALFGRFVFSTDEKIISRHIKKSDASRTKV